MASKVSSCATLFVELDSGMRTHLMPKIREGPFDRIMETFAIILPPIVSDTVVVPYSVVIRLPPAR